MHINLSARTRKIFLRSVLGGIILILYTMGIGSPIVHAQKAETLQPGKSYTLSTITLSNGTTLKKHDINGSVVPPAGFEAERQPVALPKSNGTTTNSLGGAGTPAWVIGCSPTAAGDIAAFYDREEYPNIYSGPANGGVMPLDNSLWPTWSDVVGDIYSNNPLIASHMGVDGRITRGTIDDYWVSYNSTAPDPYITGGWTQHAWDSIGDYMYTSQSAFGNIDGATAFYYDPSGIPATCDEMASQQLPDGTLGMKHFYESRGYAVGTCYNQVTDNVSAGGFSFAQFKAEIDAGRPVMLGLTDHSVVGIGYDAPSNTIYIHDGWDFDTHTMVWGGSYAGMALQDVSIVNLAPVYAISGNAGVAGATLSYTDGTPKTVTANGSGDYSISVQSGWAGTVTPYKTGYLFTPVNRSYGNLQGNQSAQNYSAQACASCADVDVAIGGTLKGSYTLLPGQSQKVVYNLDSGPVKVQSLGGEPIVAALRDALLVNGGLKTFSQLMGLPDEQLSDTYWFPTYVNNSTLSGQLRFANVGVADTTVTVTIGGVNRGSYLLHPNENKKVVYDLDMGPVKVHSTGGVPIVAALRDALLVNGSLSTFSQLMGIPDEGLSDTYWFPAYVNNSALSGQLRFANVGVADTTVTVTIGGVNRGSYLLHPNENKKVVYDLDLGPVKVHSSGGVPIVAALRDALLVNGSLSTFSQMMGIPDEGLSDTYWIPAYVNNSTLNGQLRFGNVGVVDTTVTVTIGGVDRGSYLLHPNENKKMVYDLDLGPVKLHSTGSVPIVAALRDALLVNGSLSTFSQMMGLPDEQLSAIYWIPLYVNNSTLNGQLRFGVP